MSARFPATRRAALARWQEFLANAPSYGARRNSVLPGHDNVSRLSAAIRHRLVLGEELLATLLAAHPLAHVEKLAQELLWRDYWRAWLALRPGIWHEWTRDLEPMRAALDARARHRLDAAEAGASGLAVMDDFARELVATGYLHNHARMWFASWWVHVERLPWQLGAAFFFRHLLDGDAASNTLSWRWVAGLHTAGKRYFVRRSNIEKYLDPSLLRHPTGLEQLDDDVITRLEADPHPHVAHPEPLAPDRSADDQRAPPPGRWGLWLHEQDCCVERSAWAGLSPTVLIATHDTTSTLRFGYGALRQAYTRAALQDATARARQHFGAALSCSTELEATAEPWWEALARVGREHGLHGFVGIAPAVGPLADQLPELRARLAQAGLALLLLTRPSDHQALHHARGGFFGYWTKRAAELR